MCKCKGHNDSATLNIKRELPRITSSNESQSQKTQGFRVADFATLSDERRSRSKVVLLVIQTINGNIFTQVLSGRAHHLLRISELLLVLHI